MMMTASRSDPGRAAAGPAALDLTAGPLSARFEPDTAMLRDVRWHGAPALMAVYAAVRDRSWGTVPPTVHDLHLERTARGLVLRFTVACERDEIAFHWRAVIRVAATGRLSWRLDGRAATAFYRNRIGFCVLHAAADCAGRPCWITHTDGRATDGRFPARIAPHQPFLDVRCVAHPLPNGAECRVDCRGDAFEMEDQRNWSDASFKTYCTPLARPFPVPVAAGDRVRQTVTVVLTPPTRATRPPRRPAADGRMVPAGRAAPRLPTLGHAWGDGDPTTDEAALVRDLLRPDFLRLTVAPGAPEWEQEVAQARRRAAQVGAGIAAVLTLSEEAPAADLQAIRRVFARRGVPVCRWLVLPPGAACTPPGWLGLARAALQDLFPAAEFGVGTRGNFAELNRGRPAAAGADSVAYALAAEVHVTDRQSILENAAAAEWTAAGARRLYPGRSIAVEPVAFRQQRNPVAATPPVPRPGALPAARLAADRLPDVVDPRQASLFGAGFALGVVGALALGGARSVGLFDVAGMTGLMECRAAPPRPPAFPPMHGRVYPAFHVLADLREVAGLALRRARVQADPDAPAFVFHGPTGRRLLVANPRGESLTLRLPGTDSKWHCRVLDEKALPEALASPREFRRPERLAALRGTTLELPPWAYTCVTEEF